MNKERGIILITPRSLSKNGHPALRILEDAGFSLRFPWPGDQPSQEQLLAEIPSAVGYLAGVEPITEAVLEAATSLKIISRNGVGLDNVDLQAAKRLNIAVEGVPGANAQSVAELALALMLDGFRSISWSNAHLKNNNWKRQIGTEIQGKTLGIIGCGNIGQRLAAMAVGIGMRVIGYDIYQNPTMLNLDGFAYVDLNQLFAESDAISLHCPPEKTPLLTADTLAQMKDSLILVNTARDALVDHESLIAALDSGKVGMYLTDVFDREPVENKGLYSHEKVVMTPHIGGFTGESVQRATEMAVENILNYFSNSNR